MRPVTGYPQAFDWTTNQLHPTNDGVFKIDIGTGEKQLLVSFAQLAARIRPSRPDVENQALFINHTLNNPESDHIFFFVRGNFDQSNRINQGFVMHADGSELTLMKKTHRRPS